MTRATLREVLEEYLGQGYAALPAENAEAARAVCAQRAYWLSPLVVKNGS